MKDLKDINENHIMKKELDLILDFVNEERRRAKNNNEPKVLSILDKILDEVFEVKLREFKMLRSKGLNL